MKYILALILSLIITVGNAQTTPKTRGSESTTPKGVTGTTAPAKTTGATQNTATLAWEPIIEMEGNVYTSYIYAASLMPNRSQDKDEYKGDKNGQIGIKITPSAANARIKLTIEAPEIMNITVYEEEFERH